MPLTREMDSPLLSEDEALRKASLLAITNVPTPEAAKAVINALLHFLKERPEVAPEFEHVLYTPPLGPLAEEPLLQLLDEDDDAVREEAAYILFRLKIRSSSRARMLKALTDDDSHWVRAYAAKALAMLQGSGAGAQLATAIDDEATLEAIARMGEALALTGDASHAAVLRDQAEQLRERSAPPDAVQPDLWVKSAGEIALLFDALAAHLEGQAPAGATLEARGDNAWRYSHPDLGTIEVGGGPSFFGYAARVTRGEGVEVLELDSHDAMKLLAQSDRV
ncbi:MAG: HEAT repeat domain-containing protein [Deltaproteobacteria bacterium]|nr:HEAT repeat domain-containing protein [Deltaproteobacteria bacterium]